MRRLKWMIPLIAITIFLFSVGLASANMTGTLLSPSTGADGGDAFQLVPVEKKAGTRKGYVGTFTSGVASGVSGNLVQGDFFTVTTKKGDVEIRVPAGGLSPITKTPGGPNVAAVLEDGAPEDDARVAVLVDFVQDGNDVVREAHKIVVKPVPQTPYNGPVASVETGEDGVSTVTIVNADGTTEEVELGPDVAAPAIGEVVIGFRGRGVGARSAGGREGNGRPVIKGLVRAAAVHDRLQGFLKNLGADRDGLPEIAAEKQELRIERVRAILEKHANRRVVIIERLIGRQNMSPRALEAIADRLENARANREEAKANRERAQAARDEAKPVGDGATPGRQDQDRGRRNPR